MESSNSTEEVVPDETVPEERDSPNEDLPDDASQIPKLPKHR